ncbi:MAG: hypothetical protein ACKO7N_02055 [Candidatus Nitrosotenuis sp.]
MWSLDLDSDFFRIFDKDRKIAGYFWPDYGQILPENKYDEIVQLMHKNHDSIPGGFMTVPMVKFGIFDNNQEMDVLQLSSKISDVSARLDVWREFLLEQHMQHSIQMSHTDNDMLSLSFPVKFTNSVSLDKKKILEALLPTLDLLSQKGLL